MESNSLPMINMSESEMDAVKGRIDKMLLQVNKLELSVDELEQFYSENNKKKLNSSKTSSNSKDKDKGRHISSIKMQQVDATNMEDDVSKRMQVLLRQFGTILRQITLHKMAGPFMEPVNVEVLGCVDYYQVIEKPMDFGTIKKRLEAKDGCGYKHVREACADLRLVFKNAMNYNDETHPVHDMAKSLLAKFEEKWLQLLPKVLEEEKRLVEEKSEARRNVQLAQESAYAEMARNASAEILAVDMQLEELRALVVQNCRKFSSDEKRRLGTALTRLSTEDLSKALEIVAQANPSFQATAEEVDLDIDAQSESTLWRLKFFVKSALQAQSKPSASAGVNNDDNKNNNKRKQEISVALARNAKRRSKKVGGS